MSDKHHIMMTSCTWSLICTKGGQDIW